MNKVIVSLSVVLFRNWVNNLSNTNILKPPHVVIFAFINLFILMIFLNCILPLMLNK